MSMLMYKGFSFEIPRDTIYQLPTPTYRKTNTTIHGLSDYETVCYIFHEDIVTAKQFQAICTVKILLKLKVPQITFTDAAELNNNLLDRYYYVNELKGLVGAEFVKYQKPLLAYSKKDVYSNICKYAQRLHYERQLHLEGVIYGALTINSKLQQSESFSYKDILKKAYSAFYNVQLNKTQKLLTKDLHKAHVKGGNVRGKQKSDEVLNRIELINTHLNECINQNGKTNFTQLSYLTQIPKSTLYRLTKSMLND